MGKVRESGMPDEGYWESFFDPECVLTKLDCRGLCGDVIEFGCGYGSFIVAAAKLVPGTVYGIDIEPQMVRATADRAMREGLANVRAEQRDFVADGCGRPDGSVGYAMLFNILHLEDPVGLLREAYRVLTPGGLAGVIHWKPDPLTPRGPSLEIRPRPEQCRTWAEEAGFEFVRSRSLTCCSWHYGLLFRRPQRH